MKSRNFLFLSLVTITFFFFPGAANALVDCTDADGDGYYAEEECEGEKDCDDGNYNIHPGAIEHCDHINNDCDDETDEGCTPCLNNSDCDEGSFCYKPEGDCDGAGVCECCK